ncbi:hypothetical protein [Butyrivibrio sp. XPD2002]|uniref:hypothetical protein n=1 Tax=Butyrivibrio sp. XPD2002 TaxID=1280665 RepID=UPI0004256D04|nr:hypothetical protein [Butyrivibrio sp. XPD2002]
MAPLIIFCFLILSGDYLAVSVFRCKFGEITPFTFCIIPLIAYIFGLLNILHIGAYAVCFFAAGAYIVGTVFLYKRRDFSLLKNGFYEYTFVTFLIVGTLALWGDYGQLASGYDDIGHWQDCVKTMICIDDFYANPIGHSTFGTYPPFMALIQYVIQVLQMSVFGTEFCEWINIYIYHMFTFSLFLPVMGIISKKAKWTNYMIWVGIIIILPTILFQRVFASTMIDPFMSVAAGVMFFLIAKRKEFRCSNIILCALIPGIAITKDLGLLFAAFGAAFLLYCSVKEKSRCGIIPLIGTVVAKISWNEVIRINHAVDAKPNSVNWYNYVLALLGEYGDLEEYKIQCVSNYRRALFDKTAFIGNSFLKVDISFFVLFAVMLLTFLLWYMKMKRRGKQGYLLANLIFYCAMLVTFLFGLGGVYMDKFVYTEAVSLASYTRYVNTLVNVLLVELVLFYLTDSSIPSSRIAVITLGVLLIIAPINNIFSYITRAYPRTQHEARKDADLFAQEIVENCNDGANVYLVSQRDRGWDYLVIKFMSRPSICLQSIVGDDYNWSFVKEDDPNDIYVKEMSLERWSNELFEEDMYDYVAISKVDSYFQETFISIFMNIDNVLPHSIYRVNRERRLLEPVYVRAEK